MRSVFTLSILIPAAIVLSGCSTAPSSVVKRDLLHERSQGVIVRFKSKDASISKFFDTASGYAVFPTVGKGAIWIGGAYGRGELYEKGVMVGYCDLSQATIGLQLGGQAYSEVIFFENDVSLHDFKANNFAFSANASAVAANVGASTTADYEDGVLVFTRTKGGLMFEASIGGQKFSYEAKSSSSGSHEPQVSQVIQ